VTRPYNGAVLLAVDVGNTLITLGVHDGTDWRGRWRVRAVLGKTADEYGILIQGILARAGVAEVTRVALASAVPALAAVFRELGEGWWGCPVLVVGPGVKTGLAVRTDHPSEVGPDLVANAVAAHARFGAPAVAVDFGTATSFVAVTPPGVLGGVVIAPGLETGATGLAERAAQLPRVPLAVPRTALGKNTVHAMQAGVVFGQAALVDGILARLTEEIGPAPVVATGAWAELLAPLCRAVDAVDPLLTLEGIRLIAERNP